MKWNMSKTTFYLCDKWKAERRTTHILPDEADSKASWRRCYKYTRKQLDSETEKIEINIYKEKIEVQEVYAARSLSFISFRYF